MVDQAAFLNAFRALCDAHGIADYLIVAHGLSGGEAMDWAAGAGGSENIVSDRERAAKLYFNASGAAAEVLRNTFIPPQPVPDTSPLG